MINVEVQRQLDECQGELNHVKVTIVKLGVTSSIVPYLTNYSIIRACGSIEISFKAIIADFCVVRSNKQIKRYVNQNVRESSSNPSYDNICKMLGAFDPDWKDSFKDKIGLEPDRKEMIVSLKSLVDLRNTFAHGGRPTATISGVLTYFSHAKRIVEILDEVVV